MKLAMLFLSVLLTGCAISPTYVSADRATKKAVEPLMVQAKEDHPDLAENIDNVLASWELRLKAAEGK